LRRRIAHAGVVLAGLVPLFTLVVGALGPGLGADPIERITHVTGEWGLRLLILSLAVTPLRRFAGLAWLAPYRRTFGLLAFAYATLHLLTYVGLDQTFAWGLLLEDVLERRYVTAGFAAWLCMLPLALTSTRSAMRRLGRRWVVLHRLAYAAGILAIAHFAWLVKADLLSPIVHGGVLALLLASRLWRPARPA
jgi:sulfoxide reductase heme-binding subunit YedZ